jgi:hypothetical protein
MRCLLIFHIKLMHLSAAGQWLCFVFQSILTAVTGVKAKYFSSLGSLVFFHVVAVTVSKSNRLTQSRNPCLASSNNILPNSPIDQSKSQSCSDLNSEKKICFLTRGNTTYYSYFIVYWNYCLHWWRHCILKEIT